jgi:hypothetical protein
MRATAILTFAAAVALSVPALAQEAGSPGAVGTGNGLTGSNPGTDVQRHWNGYDSGYGTRVYPPGPGPYGYDYDRDYPAEDGVIHEGRAAAPDVMRRDRYDEDVDR